MNEFELRIPTYMHHHTNWRWKTQRQRRIRTKYLPKRRRKILPNVPRPCSCKVKEKINKFGPEDPPFHSPLHRHELFYRVGTWYLCPRLLYYLENYLQIYIYLFIYLFIFIFYLFIFFYFFKNKIWGLFYCGRPKIEPPPPATVSSVGEEKF